MNQSLEDLQRERDELIAADAKTIRSLSAYIETFIEQENICVVGSSGKLREEEHYFDILENLI